MLSAFITSISITVQLIVRIKTCPVKTTRWLLNIRRAPQRSRRSAPRPRLKRLQPAWPVCGNSTTSFIREKSRQRVIVFVFQISQIPQKLKSQRHRTVRSLLLSLMSLTFLISLVQTTLILTQLFRKPQVFLVELYKLFRAAKIPSQLLGVFRI